MEEYVGEGEGERCVILINGRLDDVTGYLVVHAHPFLPPDLFVRSSDG